MVKQHRQLWARSSRRSVVAVLSGLSIAATVTGTSSAASVQAPPGDSAVIQYAELVPTGDGDKAPGVGKKTKAGLPATAKKALAKEPAATAKALTEVATSSDYGAPTTSSGGPASTLTKPVPVIHDTPSPSRRPSLDRTLSATAAAVSPVGESRMVGLVVVLVAIVVTGGMLAVRAHRP